MIIMRSYFTIRKVDEKDIEKILNVYKNCEDFLSLGPVPHASKQMISKRHRRKGIGMDAVKAVEAEIHKNKSVNSILAGVQTNNQPAIAFWEKMGYKIISQPQLLPDTTIVFKLQKDLI